MSHATLDASSTTPPRVARDGFWLVDEQVMYRARYVNRSRAT